MKYLPYLLIVLISALALKSLFSAPLIPLFHDQVQSERTFEMVKAISFSQYPARMVGDVGYGYGYPLFNFYGPFPYYVGAFLYLLGFPLFAATKFAIAIAFTSAGLSMFVLVKKYYGKGAALIAAVVYMLAPYHGVELYVRGSIGELYTYALAPLVLAGLLSLWHKERNVKIELLGSISLALLAISHTIGLFMITVVIIIYIFGAVLYLVGTKKEFLPWIKRNAKFLALAFALSAFFTIPALGELKYTNFSVSSGNDVNYSDHFVTLAQVWSSPWGFGGSAKGDTQDGMSFMIGKVTILLAIITIGIALVTGRKKIPAITHPKLLFGLGILAGMSVFFMLPISSWAWEKIPYMPLIQFPWRFLIFANLSMCFLAGAGITYLRQYFSGQKYRYAVVAVFLISTYLYLFPLVPNQKLSTKYFETNGWYQLSESEAKSTRHLRFAASRISDEYLPNTDLKIHSPEDISKDTVSCLSLCIVKNVEIFPSQYKIEVIMEKNALVYIDKLNFPQFETFVDGKRRETVIGPHNFIGVQLPPGPHTVIWKLKNSPIRNIANAISLLAFIGLILYPFRSNLKVWKQKLNLKSLKI